MATQLINPWHPSLHPQDEQLPLPPMDDIDRPEFHRAVEALHEKRTGEFGGWCGDGACPWYVAWAMFTKNEKAAGRYR